MNVDLIKQPKFNQHLGASTGMWGISHGPSPALPSALPFARPLSSASRSCCQADKPVPGPLAGGRLDLCTLPTLHPCNVRPLAPESILKPTFLDHWTLAPWIIGKKEGLEDHEPLQAKIVKGVPDSTWVNVDLIK